MEAFSDIVIGFSLAQVAVSLSPQTFFTHRAGLIAFVITFLGVSTIWWTHNRLFAKYFVPDRLSIIINFAALGCMVLFVFSIQLFVSTRDFRALPFYFGMYGLVTLLLSSLYILGSRQRRVALSPEDYDGGIRRGVRAGIVACGMLLAAAALYVEKGAEDRIGITIFVCFGVAIAAIKILERFFPVLKRPKR